MNSNLEFLSALNSFDISKIIWYGKINAIVNFKHEGEIIGKILIIRDIQPKKYRYIE